jgi:hypothetical protein
MLKKIADLQEKEPCLDPEHNPPAMIVLEPGIYEHTCPSCNNKIRFTIYANYSM